MSSPPESAEVDQRPKAGPVLVETKLLAPARRQVVPRLALLERLRASPDVILTLVVAPAGWGKTTLLANWYASGFGVERVAWLTVDRADDPGRFWTHLIGALRTFEPDIGARALEALPVPGASFVELGLPSLINEITELEGPVMLVLDDYHLARHHRIHEGMTFLLEHMPPSFHLVLSTRSDPPLPLARLRAGLDMVEIRAHELRFSDDEASALLNDLLGLGLDPEQVAQLRDRTEGWAAGLCLAALSLQGRRDPHTFIATFAGNDRHVVDYLSSEVLAGQPEEARTFLMRTSILDPLCASLCDEVVQISNSAEMLESIERSNSFLVPLDAKREWYRYHHLFGELLGHELSLAEHDLVPELHRRAGSWFKRVGLLPEAIQHSIAAGNIDDARELVAAHWSDYFNQGMLDAVEGWLDALPPEAVAGDTRLCQARAWLAMDRGQVDEAEHWISAAEAATSAEGMGETTVGSETAVLRAVHGFKIGSLAQANEAARRVLEIEPHGASFARTVAYCILGITEYWSGDTAAATVALEEAHRLARETANDLATSYALGYLALVQVERGDASEGERLAVEATGLSDASGFTEHFVTMMGHLARGLALERLGDLGGAERSATRSLTLARRGAAAIETASSLLALSDLLRARGDRDEASAAQHEAEILVKDWPEQGKLADRIRATGRRLHPSPDSTASPTPVGGQLTDRELVVLRLLQSPLSRREIGEALFVSQNTVKTHTRGIYRKLDATSREEAVRKARELGLL